MGSVTVQNLYIINTTNGTIAEESYGSGPFTITEVAGATNTQNWVLETDGTDTFEVVTLSGGSTGGMSVEFDGSANDDGDNLYEPGDEGFALWYDDGSPEGVALLATDLAFTAGDTVDFNALNPANYAICFPAGTMFTTSEGTKPVEELQAGDMLTTLEGQQEAIRFIGTQILKPHPVHGHLERNLPILIKKHALGPNMPSRDLTTTWWHSVMLEGDWIEQQFGSRQIFVPAGRLVNGDSIQTVQTTETLKVYVPMLPAHEVIFAEGAPMESFRPDNGNQHEFSNTADYPLHHLSQDEQEALYPSKFPRILDKDLCAAIRAHMTSRNIDARLIA